MSSETTTNGAAYPGLSNIPKEAQLLVLVCLKNKSKPDLDWNEIAKTLDYKNGKSARDRFGQIMAKYKPILQGDEKSTMAASVDENSSVKSTKRKRTEDKATSPAKRAKRGASKLTAEIGNQGTMKNNISEPATLAANILQAAGENIDGNLMNAESEVGSEESSEEV